MERVNCEALAALQPTISSVVDSIAEIRANAAIRNWIRFNQEVLSPNYLRGVQSDWDLFRKFCAHSGRDPLPASAGTVAAFVETMAHTRAPGTVRRYLSSISVLHDASGHPNPQKTPEVAIAIRRMHVQKGRSQKQALGLTRDLVNKLLAKSGSRLKDLRDRALLVTAYDTLLRRSELVSLRVEDVRWEKDGCATVLVRSSKTDREGGGYWTLVYRDSAILLRRWLTRAKITSGCVFRSVRKNSSIGSALPAGQVSRIYKEMARSAGLDEDVVQHLSGHSTRVGAVQDMVANSIGLPAIMLAGRWKSEAMVQRYSRHLLVRDNGSAQLAKLQKR